jgi:hypothetical protein
MNFALWFLQFLLAGAFLAVGYGHANIAFNVVLGLIALVVAVGRFVIEPFS